MPTPRSCTPNRFALVAVFVMSGCSADSEEPEGESSSAEEGSESSETPSEEPLPALEGVAVDNATITVDGTTGRLSAGVRNDTDQPVVLRAVASPGAQSVQFGQVEGDTVVPLADGASIDPGVTLELGAAVTALLTFEPAPAAGAEVPLTFYFDTAGTVDTVAVVA